MRVKHSIGDRSEYMSKKNIKVVFRVFPGGAVIALFPKMLVCDYEDSIVSYMRIGQHSSASPKLIKQLKPATKSEYAALLKELIDLVGYKNLKVGS